MEKKTVRTGIVGAGFAASFHYEALSKVHGVNVEVVGVYCPPEEQRREYAAKRGIWAFDSLDSLIDAVDVVHVCTPPVVHEAVAVAALERDKFAIVEKPLTGYFGDGSDAFNGDTFPKQDALDFALASIERMLAAEAKSKGRILYAENWVYAPSIQKEREIVEKTGAQILWIHGEEAHSGSHAATYAYWKFSGGGVMIGKGCHPLTAALYLKRVEGLKRSGVPIRPQAVSARTHAITRLKGFRDEGYIRADYHDIDDFSAMHVIFEDGTIADIFASDIVLGGIHNWLEVSANNHRTICNINPNNAMQTYNACEANFADIYVVEKIGTKQGWSNPSPDEDWFTGYPQEMEAFYRTIAYGQPPESDSRLAADCISTIYSAYVSAERKGAEVAIKAF
ncbi:MAG TPA: Gfo/Idh/MocA family oxidoreductase [Anaerohalosphaeraceae bacterium]|jgi:predicted dehydrogenase|nr:Gfo/Idh/MocA family oxidoreductase [Anaerohalosphaeraceae bacterium]HRT49622.1 Gfo/Idh/MocA family oxidoreductase [Anaerohalosphaeraceae bacterium]HRT85443.1 Gfo/Idh/MocA family oxidoreductase [Anaerohalosphaeraceae bacterium]